MMFRQYLKISDLILKICVFLNSLPPHSPHTNVGANIQVWQWQSPNLFPWKCVSSYSSGVQDQNCVTHSSCSIFWIMKMERLETHMVAWKWKHISSLIYICFNLYIFYDCAQQNVNRYGTFLAIRLYKYCKFQGPCHMMSLTLTFWQFTTSWGSLIFQC